MKKVLAVRLRDIPLKCNFSNAFSDKKCAAAPLCDKDETNQHLFSCEFMSTDNEICIPDLKYECIFSDNYKIQETITNMIYQRMERRKTFLTPSDMGPADPRKRKPPTLGIKEARKGKKSTQRKNLHFSHYLVSYWVLK